MLVAALCFLVGILVLQFSAILPSANWCLLIPIAAILLVYPKIRWLIWLVLGFFWALVGAQDRLTHSLPISLIKQPLIVEGYVLSIPKFSQTEDTRFDLDQVVFKGLNNAERIPKRIHLSWRATAPSLLPGSKWRLRVKLKPPHGFFNPGGFDYEGWLFIRGIRATGYVVDDPINQQLEIDHLSAIERLRFHVMEKIRQLAAETTHLSLIVALAVGVQDWMSLAQWQVLNRSGTSHLLAISGFHIGMLAGLGYFLGRKLGVRITIHYPQFSALLCAAGLSIAVALFYSALAGFSVPTQRTLIMIVVLMMGFISGRNVAWSDVYALALFAVLFHDPFAVFAPGFWLSFGTVAIIIYTMAGRWQVTGWWWQYVRVHWLVACALTPVLLGLFGQAPLLGVLANIIAVPYISFLVVPLVLFSTATIFVSEWLAAGLFILVDKMIDWIWTFLEKIALQDYAVWSHYNVKLWVLVSAFAGILLIVAPRGLPGRYLGVIWLLPLFFYRTEPIAYGDARINFLDVGQGTSVVVQTTQHVLLYDTGASYSPSFDSGNAVIIPFLRTANILKLDKIMISHGDRDHIGGLVSVLSEYSADQVISSQGVTVNHPHLERCYTGQHWEWDGVTFEVLSPDLNTPDSSDNNLSCVLRIATLGANVLLTGDIEAVAEKNLVIHHREKLMANILLAPHHGSNTSSIRPFINAVRPDYVIYPVGYLNRFHFPAREVVQRYERYRVKSLNLAEEGAVTFYLSSKASLLSRHRKDHGRYWHRL